MLQTAHTAQNQNPDQGLMHLFVKIMNSNTKRHNLINTINPAFTLNRYFAHWYSPIHLNGLLPWPLHQKPPRRRHLIINKHGLIEWGMSRFSAII